MKMRVMDIVLLMLSCVVALSECRGSGQPAYRAKRYGSYYKSTYYSYTDRGYARYSRVYSRARNLYTSYYNYMFTWMNTNAYTVYKSTPSDSISVCKNYEANENGTFMGIFTCPLPYVPEDHAYCCGLENAEYCCKFWDIPLNIAAVSVGAAMGLGLFLITIYVIVQLCIQKHIKDAESIERKTTRRFNMISRQFKNGSLWQTGALWTKSDPVTNSRESLCSEQSVENKDTNKDTNNVRKINVNNVMFPFSKTS